MDMESYGKGKAPGYLCDETMSYLTDLTDR